ncbi:DUF4148 domain-containing protein [Caballeronia sp. 15711]|uniref:DUF4148 domain-containing protein n=1 Tax=Caballeronia sp. 15711 TaxID=3391029 RepID=UPI0039E4E9D8
MKLITHAIFAAVILVVSGSTFAQSNAPLTRAQVREHLIEIEKAGYNPSSNLFDYPVNIQAAEARVAAQNTALGGVASGSSQRGYIPDSQ